MVMSRAGGQEGCGGGVEEGMGYASIPMTDEQRRREPSRPPPVRVAVGGSQSRYIWAVKVHVLIFE